MGSPNSSTYEATPAHRPSLDDFNGANKTDDLKYPPNPLTMPNSAEQNTLEKTVVSLGQVTGSGRISIRYSAGAPVLDSFATARAGVVGGAFTIGRTGGGATSGDISITWAAGTFPTPLTQPGYCCINSTSPLGAISVSAITNGIRIITVNMSNTATDLAFTAEIT